MKRLIAPLQVSAWTDDSCLEIPVSFDKRSRCSHPSLLRPCAAGRGMRCRLPPNRRLTLSTHRDLSWREMARLKWPPFPMRRKLNRLSNYKAILAVALLLLSAHTTFAATECRVTPTNLFVGGDSPAGHGSNYFFVNYAEGGAGVVYQNDKRPLTAVVMAAKTSQRTLVVRYQADNVNCATQNPGVILGMWLT